MDESHAGWCSCRVDECEPLIILVRFSAQPVPSLVLKLCQGVLKPARGHKAEAWCLSIHADASLSLHPLKPFNHPMWITA